MALVKRGLGQNSLATDGLSKESFDILSTIENDMIEQEYDNEDMDHYDAYKFLHEFLETYGKDFD